MDLSIQGVRNEHSVIICVGLMAGIFDVGRFPINQTTQLRNVRDITGLSFVLAK